MLEIARAKPDSPARKGPGVLITQSPAGGDLLFSASSRLLDASRQKTERTAAWGRLATEQSCPPSRDLLHELHLEGQRGRANPHVVSLVNAHESPSHLVG
jgi:hypothetical protein